jgi:hypothetical protein
MSIDRDILMQVKSAPSAMQRAQTAAASEQAGIVFYRFQGRPIKTTRPWCLAREGKVWHIEEIREWGRQAAAGQGWDGMVEGTNEQTIMTYLGGWYGDRSACRHVLVPVLASRVPAEDMERMRAKGLLGANAPTTQIDRTQIDQVRNAWEESVNSSDYYQNLNTELRADFRDRVKGSISAEQLEAVKDYTGNEYRQINGVARGISTPVQRVIDKIGVMRSALDDFRLQKDVVVFRGAGKGDTADRLAKMARSSAIGSEFSLRGFTSTTLDARSSFIQTSTTIFRMRVPKGSRALYLEDFTENRREFELLLDEGATFRILGTEQLGAKTFIDIELVP